MGKPKKPMAFYVKVLLKRFKVPIRIGTLDYMMQYGHIGVPIKYQLSYSFSIGLWIGSHFTN